MSILLSLCRSSLDLIGCSTTIGTWSSGVSALPPKGSTMVARSGKMVILKSGWTFPRPIWIVLNCLSAPPKIFSLIVVPAKRECTDKARWKYILLPAAFTRSSKVILFISFRRRSPRGCKLFLYAIRSNRSIKGWDGSPPSTLLIHPLTSSRSCPSVVFLT